MNLSVLLRVSDPAYLSYGSGLYEEGRKLINNASNNMIPGNCGKNCALKGFVYQKALILAFTTSFPTTK